MQHDYPEIVETVWRLTDLLASTLDVRLLAVYLTGSLVTGDFDPVSSDIDFVAIVDGELDGRQLGRLQEQYDMLRREMCWASRVEGPHLPLARCAPDGSLLRRYHELVLTGAVEYCQPTCQWLVQLHLARRHGVPLIGPAPAQLLPEIPRPELRRAATVDVGRLVPDLAGPQPVRTVAYRVLLLCRMLYAQAYGEIASKPAAASWAASVLDPQWSATIEWALAARASDEVVPTDCAAAFVGHVRSLILSSARRQDEEGS